MPTLIPGRATAFGFFLAVLSGCATTQTYVAPDYRGTVPAEVYGASPYAPAPTEDAPIAYSVYLLGEMDDPSQAEAVLAALRVRAQSAGEASAVVLLGGMVPERKANATAGRNLDSSGMTTLADALRGYQGRVFAVPGDEEWASGAAGVRRFEDALEAALNRGDVVLPGDARGGPAVIELSEDVVLVGIDTGWLMTQAPKPFGVAASAAGADAVLEVEREVDVMEALEKIVARHADDVIIVAGHHPLRSNGPVGGYFSTWDALLPPIFGAAEVLVDELGGAQGRLHSSTYRAVREALEPTLYSEETVVYAASHANTLEYFPLDDPTHRRLHHVVSGGMADADPVVQGRGAAFAATQRGFFVVQVLTDGTAWLNAVAVSPGGPPGGAVVFHTPLRGPVHDRINVGVTPPDGRSGLSDSTVVTAIDPTYDAGRVWQPLTGPGYRSVWATPVPFPVLDLGREAGGLTPVSAVGRLQSVTLRLRGADGNQYVLRLLEPVAQQSLPEDLRRTIVADALRQQVVATNPYAAPAVARLAAAAGLYHTSPRLVFVPDDPRLGRFRSLFANKPALFEVRSGHDLPDGSPRGRLKPTLSSAELNRNLREDHTHRVDQHAFLRARLFDLLIADWDRHPGQWQWAAFEPTDLDPENVGTEAGRGIVYRPIPQDRDYAFNRAGGLLTRAALFVTPGHQPFREDYRKTPQVLSSGRALDRRYLNAMNREDWLAAAAALQNNLTDEAIDAALAVWPPPVDSLAGSMTRATLRARRDALAEAAENAYAYYAQTVDIVGSDQQDKFVATRASDGTLEVSVEALNETGEPLRTVYHRRFIPGETREVRLYGLRGNDTFLIVGAHADIAVHVIGGAGADRVENQGRGDNVTVYDSHDAAVSVAGPARLNLADGALRTIRYDPLNFPEATLESAWLRVGAGGIYPLGTASFGQLEGVLISVGGRYENYDLRRGATVTHAIMASYATRTGGWGGMYAGVYPGLLPREWAGFATLEAASPNFAFYFHGLSNERDRDQADAFYQVQRAYGRLSLGAQHTISDRITLRFGPLLSVADADRPDEARTIASPGGGLPARDFEAQSHAGAQFSFRFSNLERPANPRQGWRWTVNAAGLAALNEAAASYGLLESEVAAFIPVRLSPQFTLATRAGVSHRLGTFPFYDAALLGGAQVRGLLLNRYAGRTATYQTIEARAKLFRFVSYLLVGDVGVKAFADNGRVWAPSERSSRWHQAFGGGVWLSLLDQVVVSATLARGDEGVLFSAGAGFFF